jgi:hypothetical protein
LGGDCEAGNSTGTLTQPVFNELARLIRDRLSDTNYTLPQSPLLLFPGNHRNVYQAPHLNFYVGPRLTFGTPPQTRSVIGILPNDRLSQIIMSVNE